MPEFNPKNERIKLDYEDYLRVDVGLAESTITQKLDAIYRFESATGFADFKTFDRDKAIAFVETITTAKLANATRLSIINHVKAFFRSLAMDGVINGKKSRRAISALRLNKKDTRAAQGQKPKEFATIAEFKEIVEAMPFTTAIELRNRALIAFTPLSGARDGAIISMRLKHVDLARREIKQYPDEVDTKASKLIATWFFTVDPIFKELVADYIDYLRNHLGFTDEDPLFPSDLRGHDENHRFISIGLSKERWSTANRMRAIFKRAFTDAGFTYRSPHRVRNTLMAHGRDLGLNAPSWHAWCQNFGHENPSTSFNAYGKLSHDEHRKAMSEIKLAPDSGPTISDLAKQLETLQSLVMQQNRDLSA